MSGFFLHFKKLLEHKSFSVRIFLSIVAIITLTSCKDEPTAINVPIDSTTLTEKSSTAGERTPYVTNITSSTAKISETTKPALASDWQDRWLKGIPCRPPCWEGVTPGQTTSVQAVGKWNQSPIIINARTTISPLIPDERYILWDWINGDEGGRADFKVEASRNIQVISLITPRFTKSFIFSEVIQTYGEPTHVIALAQPDIHDLKKNIYYLKLIYLTQGFALDAEPIFENNSFTKPSLSPSMLLAGPYFFVPGNTTLFKSSSPTVWQGFKDFDFYCRDLRTPDSQSCGSLLSNTP